MSINKLTQKMDNSMCRVCLSTSACYFIFDTDENNVQYSTKIQKCVNITLNVEDGLPSRICKLCTDELSVAYYFVQKCLSSDSTLRNYKDNEDFRLAEPNAQVCDVKMELTSLIKSEIEVKEENGETDANLRGPSIYDDLLPFDDYSNNRLATQPEKVRKKYTRKKPKPPKSGPLQCTECGRMVNNRSVLILHMRTHTGERPYACDACGAQFKLKGTLVRHLSKHEAFKQPKFVCEFCGKNFSNRGSIINHLSIHDNNSKYSCPFCSKQFKQRSSMHRHKTIHSGQKPHLCTICGKGFRDKNQLLKHSRTVHSDIKNFICRHCNKGFKTSDTLKVHLQYLHTNETNYICNFCGISFKFKGGMKLHIQRRHSEKSGTCHVCSKVFSNLEVHMYKHSGEKPFVCSKCSQAFSSKRSLGYHISIKHENVAKFKCPMEECKRTFPILSMLEYHLSKVHSHNATHKCPHCAKGFFRLCDLSKHMKASHADRVLGSFISNVNK